MRDLADDRHPDERSRRVLLVREWDEQVGGSGCCGRLGGVGTELGHAEDFAHVRATMVQMGEVYRALREVFPDLDVTVVDPRNWVWLVPAVYRDARRSGLSRPQAARQASRATTPASVVVGGVVVCSRDVPDPTAVIRLVGQRLGAPGPT